MAVPKGRQATGLVWSAGREGTMLEDTNVIDEIAIDEVSIDELLDDIGMAFALNTHHPLTHLEYGDDPSPEEINSRTQC
jgi:hypothetical protein